MCPLLQSGTGVNVGVSAGPLLFQLGFESIVTAMQTQIIFVFLLCREREFLQP